ncbi:ANTAR domain-containing protein [Kineococcus sp. LSe6-4]|uniref:ANTAR domain-containing protein n=1 Tax=Kineococcus halophytocola TaxID=3234027 RepID=A0ABV4H3F6_9ACTN
MLDSPPDRLRVLLADPAPHAVRSLAEDLAVARARARTAGERSRELRRRTETVLARSQELARQRPERRGAGDHAGDHAGEHAGEQDRVAALEREVEHLRRALENRPCTERAVGIVMQLLGCDADTAWDRLSRLSQHTNVKVRVVAEALAGHVASGRGVPPEVVAALTSLAAPTPAGGSPGRSRT